MRRKENSSSAPWSLKDPQPTARPSYNSMDYEAADVADEHDVEKSVQKRKFQREASSAEPKTGLAGLGIMLDKCELDAAQTTLPGTYVSGFSSLSAQRYTYASTCPDDLYLELGSQTPLPRSCTCSTVLMPCCVCWSISNTLTDYPSSDSEQGSETQPTPQVNELALPLGNTSHLSLLQKARGQARSPSGKEADAAHLHTRHDFFYASR